MDAQAFDKLAGRIDGIGQALLRVVTALEMRQLIDGPRIAAEWRQVRPDPSEPDAQLQASHRMLHQLADMLDEARQARAQHQSRRPE